MKLVRRALSSMASSLVNGLNRVMRPLGFQVLRTGISVGTNHRRVRASLAVFEALDHEIAAGPFLGTRLSPEFAWGDASVGAVVLGCYEEQLHGAIEQLIATSPDLVVNIGSAEGTYSVGLARRLPDTAVLAVDVVEAAARAVRGNAKLNGVEARVETVLDLTPDGLEQRLQIAECPAVVIDCEGCEREFLDPSVVPSLAHTSILVEVHERLVPGIGALLQSRFSATHAIEEIVETGRNPHQYDVLRPMPSIDKWLVVCEGREETMSWLWCRPKPRSAA